MCACARASRSRTGRTTEPVEPGHVVETALGGPTTAPEIPLAPGRDPKTTTAGKKRVADGRKNNGGHPNSRKPKSPWLQRAEKRREEDIARQQLAEVAATADVEQLIALAAQLRNANARDDFSEFCRQAWQVVEPATKLDWSWHHQLICNILQALFECWLRGRDEEAYVPEIVNALFNVAPGSLKSRLMVVFFPAWCWLHAPGAKFICLSVNEDVAMRDARASRDLIKSDWYQTAFEPQWSLKGDQDAISNYGNTAGGERLSKPSGSQIVGLRSDILLMDDANAPDETAEERVKINQVWDESIYTRVNSRKSLRIGIQQRVGEGDWSDHVVKSSGYWAPVEDKDKNCGPLGWLRVVLPAEFDPDRKFVMPEPLLAALRRKFQGAADREVRPGIKRVVPEDPRTVPGESVHPSRMSTTDLAAEKKRWGGTGHFAAQFNQAPANAEGNVVLREYFRFFRLARGIQSRVDELALTHARPKNMGSDVCGDAMVIKERYHRPGTFDFDWIEISVDCALKKTIRGSQWGMLCIAGRGGQRFVLDDRTMRGDILEVLKVLGEMTTFWRADRVLVEDRAAGDEMIRRIRDAIAQGDNTFASVSIEPVKVNNLGKEARLDAALPCLANNMVYLLDGASWLNAFTDEVCGFPRAQFDDRVDALSQCLNHHISEEPGGGSFELPDW